MLGIPEGPNRVVLTRGLSSGTAGTCKRGMQDLGLPRHLCWQQDQGLSLGSLAGSQQVSTKATFLVTSLSWSALCKIRFKIREQSASLRAEVSRSRYPRTRVVGDAVEAMPGSSIDHAEELQMVLGRQEDRECPCSQYFDSTSPERFNQVISNYSEKNRRLGHCPDWPSNTSTGNHITS